MVYGNKRLQHSLPSDMPLENIVGVFTVYVL